MYYSTSCTNTINIPSAKNIIHFFKLITLNPGTQACNVKLKFNQQFSPTIYKIHFLIKIIYKTPNTLDMNVLFTKYYMPCF